MTEIPNWHLVQEKMRVRLLQSGMPDQQARKEAHQSLLRVDRKIQEKPK